MARRDRQVGRALGVALAAGCLVTAPVATAGAQDLGSLTTSSAGVPGGLVPGPDRLVAVGGSPTGLCAGAVAVSVHDGGYPDSATVNWTIAMPGVGPCGLTATLTWRNLDTGATGEQRVGVPDPRLSTGPAHPYDAIVTTGGGAVEYRLVTDVGASAGPITVATTPHHR